MLAYRVALTALKISGSVSRPTAILSRRRQVTLAPTVALLLGLSACADGVVGRADLTAVGGHHRQVLARQHFIAFRPVLAAVVRIRHGVPPTRVAPILVAMRSPVS